MTKLTLVLLPATLALAACATQEADTASKPDMCNADAVQSYVGQQPTEAVQDAARKGAGAKTVRTLKPGQAVTMEYMFNRLNLYLDAEGKIERISCG